MKTVSHRGYRAGLALLVTGLSVRAGELTTATLDAGGSSVSGGAVEMDGSFGGFAGMSDSAAGVTTRAGFPGQLYDPRGLALSPDFAKMEELGSAGFTAYFRCDDDSLLPAAVDTWSVDSSFLTVTKDGIVEVGALPDDLIATLTAASGAYEGTAQLLLLNTDPDNYGPYAGDALPDAWQTLHFGGQSPDAGPAADPDADGQDNQTEYLAGTDPLDAVSLLELQFGTNPAPDMQQIAFTPFLPDRTYSLEWTDSPGTPWNALPGAPAPGAVPGEGVFPNTPDGESRKFYRLRITIP